MYNCGMIDGADTIDKSKSKCKESLRGESPPAIPISDDEDELSPTTPKSSGPKKRTSLSSAEHDKYVQLKRRKIKVAGAPKLPLTGYVRYMNDRREMLRKEWPDKSAMEHTKMIGEEWHKLSEEHKAPYIKAADLDKQRYLVELHSFLKARPDVLANELAKSKLNKKNTGDTKAVLKEKSQVNGSNVKSTKDIVKDQTQPRVTADLEVVTPLSAEKGIQKGKRTPTPNSSNNTTTPPSTTTSIASLPPPVPGEIPIFTNEFLEHNKVVDMELRTLRKSKADLEQQNAVLEKHVENMKFGVEKMTNENDELQEKNRLLEIYLEKLKRKLANALSDLAIPTEPNGATYQNIDKYMNDLYKMATSNTHGPASLNKARDIIRKLDLQIQL